ncbi:zinc finger, CCHC-type containing protein [Tanacetum coccineum]|uniref:Zinc finger, CCHC-type containing protein n=1 Tax=Tanacetum coccineum TaxID=301880 RepID=A0ABQ5DNJ0_9ASTR
MWCLFDPTPSGWCKTDAYSTDFGIHTTWEDLTTRFLAQFFPPGRTAKLCNDIMMFQQHQGESLSEAWTHFKDLLQKVPHHGIDLWLQSSLAERNRNPSSPKRVHFINSFVILNKEEGNVQSNTTEYEDHEMTVESKEEFEEETKEEIEEEEKEDSPKHFDTFPTMKKKVSRMALEKPSTPMGKGQD